MSWTISSVKITCSGIFMVPVNNVPDHPWMSWTIFISLWSCSRIFMIPVNHFPDHLLNVLDYFLCKDNLLQDIYGSCEQFPRPSLNVPYYFHIILILLWDIYDSSESFISQRMSWTTVNIMPSWIFTVTVNNFPDHLWMSWLLVLLNYRLFHLSLFRECNLANDSNCEK